MSMPNMAEALWDWDVAVELKLVKKNIADFEVDETSIVDRIFRGILQPMPPQKLLIKPEGQRLWKFWELWTQQFLELDAVIKDSDGKTYRVVSKDDWKGAGYFHYELTEGVPNE